MSDPAVIRRMNRHAARYDEFWGVRCEAAHALVLNYATRLGLAPARLLDVGCGTGKLLVRARATWPDCELVGLDPSVPMLVLARRKLPSVAFLLDGVEAIPLGDASMDLVVSTTSLGCWQDKAAGLWEVARVLRPGGSCLLADHPPPAPTTRLVMMLLRWNVDLPSLGQIDAHARRAGLEVHKLACLDGYNFLHATRPAPAGT